MWYISNLSKVSIKINYQRAVWNKDDWHRSFAFTHRYEFKQTCYCQTNTVGNIHNDAHACGRTCTLRSIIDDVQHEYWWGDELRQGPTIATDSIDTLEDSSWDRPYTRVSEIATRVFEGLPNMIGVTPAWDNVWSKAQSGIAREARSLDKNSCCGVSKYTATGVCW